MKNSNYAIALWKECCEDNPIFHKIKYIYDFGSKDNIEDMEKCFMSVRSITVPKYRHLVVEKNRIETLKYRLQLHGYQFKSNREIGILHGLSGNRCAQHLNNILRRLKYPPRIEKIEHIYETVKKDKGN